MKKHFQQTTLLGTQFGLLKNETQTHKEQAGKDKDQGNPLIRVC